MGPDVVFHRFLSFLDKHQEHLVLFVEQNKTKPRRERFQKVYLGSKSHEGEGGNKSLEEEHLMDLHGWIIFISALK